MKDFVVVAAEGVVQIIFIYSFVHSDLGVEVFFEKEWAMSPPKLSSTYCKI